jgi:hypothetical protein
MVNNKNMKVNFIFFGFYFVLVLTIFAGLYPLDFFPPNYVHWLQNENGLYFGGSGISYTKPSEPISLKKAVSIELLLKERLDSRNSGPREVFSFYDGPFAPSLLIGQWAGHIFIYSRFEKNINHKWYKAFRTSQRFPRGQVHLITVTFNVEEKAIYIDGRLSNKEKLKIDSITPLEFNGSLLIGNSYRRKSGWFGEIKGLIIYNRILSEEEIFAHSKIIFENGLSSLTKTQDCMGIYLFNERKGNTAKSAIDKPRPFYIPDKLNTNSLSMLTMPRNDIRFCGFKISDIILNIVFFLPFGIFCSLIVIKICGARFFHTFFIATIAGMLLSFLIEGLQLFLPARFPGISDILCNTFGTAFGSLFILSIIRKYF